VVPLHPERTIYGRAAGYRYNFKVKKILEKLNFLTIVAIRAKKNRLGNAHLITKGGKQWTEHLFDSLM
jgi:hypothetical protein